MAHPVSAMRFDFSMRRRQNIALHTKSISLLDDAVDADTLALCISSTLRHHTTALRQLREVIGKQVYQPVLELAKKKNGRLESGNVLILDFTAIPTVRWNRVLLVVQPSYVMIENIYKNIFKICLDLGIKKVAVPGIGCGMVKLCPTECARRFFAALKDFESSSPRNVLEDIYICDVQDKVVRGFNECLTEEVRESSINPNNLYNLVMVPVAKKAEQNKAWQLVSPVHFENVIEDECVICLGSLRDEQEKPGEPTICQLKCGHQLHFDCFVAYLKNCSIRKCCPICRKYFALPCGNQPLGSTMHHSIINGLQLAGHEASSQNTILIQYSVPDGIQSNDHLRPGVRFHGTHRTAYLPDSPEGRKVLSLLKKAFECRLIFTVGDSMTSGAQNVAVWNNIHHKTNTTGGPGRFAYPDPTYLARVTSELQQAGIDESLL